MAQAVLRHILFGLATSGLLMGCVEGSGTATTGSPGTSASSRVKATGDIEAPEVFQATDSALWDGRPSLGGIWVASPDVKDPERVVMFNPATGKTVQGALFRRERDNPGPRLQISSDAAEALGILAGQPVEIRVTALRRAEAAPAAEVAATAADAGSAEDAGSGAAAATAADGTADPAGDSDAAATAAAATAALAATGAATSAEAAAEVADGAVAAVAVAAPETTETEPPKRKTWKERRAEAKAAREAKKAAAAAAAAGGVAAGSAASVADEVPATPNAVAGTSIEAAPLESAAPPAADAAAAPEVAAAPIVVEPAKTRRQLRAEEAAAKAAAEAAAVAASTEAPAEASAEAPAAASAGRLIQVASFGKEANANRAVEALAKAGITGQTRKSEANGKVVWGVVTTGDEAQLTAIKGFGFADAFFLQ